MFPSVSQREMQGRTTSHFTKPKNESRGQIGFVFFFKQCIIIINNVVMQQAQIEIDSTKLKINVTTAHVGFTLSFSTMENYTCC